MAQLRCFLYSLSLLPSSMKCSLLASERIQVRLPGFPKRVVNTNPHLCVQAFANRPSTGAETVTHLESSWSKYFFFHLTPSSWPRPVTTQIRWLKRKEPKHVCRRSRNHARPIRPICVHKIWVVHEKCLTIALMMKCRCH